MDVSTGAEIAKFIVMLIVDVFLAFKLSEKAEEKGYGRWPLFALFLILGPLLAFILLKIIKKKDISSIKENSSTGNMLGKIKISKVYIVCIALLSLMVVFNIALIGKKLNVDQLYDEGDPFILSILFYSLSLIVLVLAIVKNRFAVIGFKIALFAWVPLFFCCFPEYEYSRYSVQNNILFVVNSLCVIAAVFFVSKIQGEKLEFSKKEEIDVVKSFFNDCIIWIPLIIFFGCILTHRFELWMEIPFIIIALVSLVLIVRRNKFAMVGLYVTMCINILLSIYASFLCLHWRNTIMNLTFTLTSIIGSVYILWKAIKMTLTKKKLFGNKKMEQASNSNASAENDGNME